MSEAKRYVVETTATFDKQLKGLDKSTQKRIAKWIKEHLENTTQPRAYGKPLKGQLSNYWRYRVGDYRILVDIQDNRCVILAINVGKRDHIYDKV